MRRVGARSAKSALCMLMIAPPLMGFGVLVRRFSMAIEIFSLGVEAPLAARSRIWGLPLELQSGRWNGGGIRFAVVMGV